MSYKNKKKFVFDHSSGAYDYYYMLDPDFDGNPHSIGARKVLVCVESESQGAAIMRDSKDEPGRLFSADLVEVPEGMPVISNVKAHLAEDYHTVFKDPKSGKSVEFEFPKELAGLHQSFLSKRCAEGAWKAFIDELSLGEMSPMPSFANMVLANKIDAKMKAIDASSADSYRKIYTLYSHNPRFSAIPADLLPVFAVCNPSTSAANKSGKGIFATKDEESALGMILSGSKDEKECAERLIGRISGINRAEANTLARAFFRASGKSRSLLLGQLKACPNITECQMSAEAGECLAYLSEKIAGIRESDGIYAVSTIISAELHDIIEARCARHESVGAASVIFPGTIVQCGGKYYEASESLDSSGLVLFGPLDGKNSHESLTARCNAVQRKYESEDETMEYEAIRKNILEENPDMVLPLESFADKTIVFGKKQYILGPDLQLYGDDIGFCSVSGFVSYCGEGGMSLKDEDLNNLPAAAKEVLGELKRNIRGRHDSHSFSFIINNFSAILPKCENAHKDDFKHLSEKDRISVIHAAVAINEGIKYREAWGSSRSIEEVFPFESIFDPNVSVDMPAGHFSAGNDSPEIRIKTSWANAILDAIAQKEAESALTQYYEMLGTPFEKKRLQMPNLQWFRGKDRGFALEDAEITDEGRYAFYEASRRSAREVYKAINYIYNGFKQLPSGDIPDAEMVAGIYELLPRGKERHTLGEILKAGSEYSQKEADRYREKLLGLDGKTFADNSRKIEQFRRDTYNGRIMSAISAPINLMTKLGQSLESGIGY